MMENNRWYEKFMEDLSRDIKEYFLVVIVTSNSMQPILYEVIENEVSQSGQLDRKMFNKYFSDFEVTKERGVHIYRYQRNILVENKLIRFYNYELFSQDLSELLLFQKYGLYPREEDRKKILKKSIKAEKIKDTLVYACYLNDTDKILKCLENATKAQLDKRLQYYGTPLGICAENDNLIAFKAIIEKGADLNKTSLSERPLKIAFQYSPNIVYYIYENHREQFDKEVKCKGFLIAGYTTDIKLLELLKLSGCDMECDGKPSPPLHTFVDCYNMAGIQFLAEQGANLHIKNVHKQTALDRAKRYNNTEAIQLLEKFLAL